MIELIYTMEIKQTNGTVVFSGTVDASPEQLEKIKETLPQTFQVVPRKLEFLRFRLGAAQPKETRPRIVGVTWKKTGLLKRLAGIARRARFESEKSNTRRGREGVTVER